MDSGEGCLGGASSGRRPASSVGRGASGDDPARFLRELRQLRDGAGLGHAELAARAHYPYDRIKAAEVGPTLPDLPVLSAYVRGCGGTTEEWEERWRSLTSAPTLPLSDARHAGGSAAASAGARIGSVPQVARQPRPFGHHGGARPGRRGDGQRERRRHVAVGRRFPVARFPAGCRGRAFPPPAAARPASGLTAGRRRHQPRGPGRLRARRSGGACPGAAAADERRGGRLPPADGTRSGYRPPGLPSPTPPSTWRLRRGRRGSAALGVGPWAGDPSTAASGRRRPARRGSAQAPGATAEHAAAIAARSARRAA